MRYEMRRLEVGDLPKVTQIYNAACRARESTQGTRQWSVAEMNNFLFELRPSFLSYKCINKEGVIGWAALTRHHDNDGLKQTAEISLYVQQVFRRKGIGSALASAVLGQASAANLHCILAMVFKDMPATISFAEGKCGFSVAGCLPEAFPRTGKYYDVLILQRLLVPLSASSGRQYHFGG